ncbi:MAG: precorrin-6y C5,15-methyltransferase (decarboxylating) subunit CbiE, partial [Planctomycetaceae bacterium]|nr:precorrin-6y C5,15-methyltransferase (decarboxylating) subunit CbiE [Planctomycetaceae bacterium]
MSSNESICIVGVGDDGVDGLTASTVDIIKQAEVLIGPGRFTESFQSNVGEAWDPGSDYEALLVRLDSIANQKIVVLAAGDPLFYGTARFLCDRLGKSRIRVIPNVSTMQLAFARVKENWDEAYLTDLGNQTIEHVVQKIRSTERVGVFTNSENTPAALATALLAARVDYFTVYVCENLGSPDERVTSGTLEEVAVQSFAPLNVMILLRRASAPDRPTEMIGKRLFGNPDEMFLQTRPKRGLLTPSQIRCLALAELNLGPTSVVWDIGAG